MLALPDIDHSAPAPPSIDGAPRWLDAVRGRGFLFRIASTDVVLSDWRSLLDLLRPPLVDAASEIRAERADELVQLLRAHWLVGLEMLEPPAVDDLWRVSWELVCSAAEVTARALLAFEGEAHPGIGPWADALEELPTIYWSTSRTERPVLEPRVQGLEDLLRFVAYCPRGASFKYDGWIGRKWSRRDHVWFEQALPLLVAASVSASSQVGGTLQLFDACAFSTSARIVPMPSGSSATRSPERHAALPDRFKRAFFVTSEDRAALTEALQTRIEERLASALSFDREVERVVAELNAMGHDLIPEGSVSRDAWVTRAAEPLRLAIDFYDGEPAERGAHVHFGTSQACLTCGARLFDNSLTVEASGHGSTGVAPGSVRMNVSKRRLVDLFVGAQSRTARLNVLHCLRCGGVWIPPER